MGHLAHLRKQLKSIHTYYDNIITLIKKKTHYLPNEILMVLHLNKIESPSSKDACIVPSLVEIIPVVLEKIFKFCQCIFAIS